jgi:hypothetical protein
MGLLGHLSCAKLGSVATMLKKANDKMRMRAFICNSLGWKNGF